MVQMRIAQTFGQNAVDWENRVDLNRLRAASGAQFDILFLQLMLRHHQGGAPMAQYVAQHGKMPQVRNLAEKMVVSQGAESDYMTQLLAQHDAQPLPPR